MSERDPALYLTDIVDSGKAIQAYVDGLSFEACQSDRMRGAAVIREFEIIGEAVAKLPEHLKNKYPEVPWREIKDFRTLLIHAYFGIDPRIVWHTIEQDLPLLIAAAIDITHAL
jgi:uncharacterized protein with HEPN domain